MKDKGARVSSVDIHHQISLFFLFLCSLIVRYTCLFWLLLCWLCWWLFGSWCGLGLLAVVLWLLMGDELVFAGLGTSQMWTLFRLSCWPWGVVSRYNLSSLLFSRTVASLHSLVWWSCKSTGCPVARCGKPLACWSWYIFWVNWCCHSSLRMLSSGCELVSFVGMFDMAFLPVRISMGLGRLDEIGVVQTQQGQVRVSLGLLIRSVLNLTMLTLMSRSVSLWFWGLRRP